jgi:hypothetical protein
MSVWRITRSQLPAPPSSTSPAKIPSPGGLSTTTCAAGADVAGVRAGRVWGGRFAGLWPPVAAPPDCRLDDGVDVEAIPVRPLAGAREQFENTARPAVICLAEFVNL